MATSPNRKLSRGDLLVLAFALLFPTAAAWIYFDLLAGHPAMRFAYGASKIIQFFLPVAWLGLAHGERFRLRGPTRQGLGMGLLFGVLVAALLFSLYYGFLRESPYLAEAHAPLWEKLQDIGADSPAKFMFLALFIATLHAFFEEYYWRWFVFGELKRGLPVALAIVLSSLGFMGHHVIVLAAYLRPEHFWSATMFFSTCVALGGAVWAWLYHRTNSLYGPWISHLIVDAGLMWVGYDLCRRYWT